MSGGRECARAREQITAYREGWLRRTGRQALEEHLADCPECRRELQREEVLCRTLAALPQDAPAPITWAQVRAAHPSPRSAEARSLRRPLLAAATALIALLMLMLNLENGPRNGSVRPPENGMISAATADAAFADAHLLVSASEMTADPNRAVLLLYSRHNIGETPR